MLKQIVASVTVGIALAAVPASAQEHRAEASVFAGWSFMDGVSGTAVRAPDGNVYDRIDPKDSFGWGFDVGFLIGPNAEVGFIFSDQPSTLQLGGTNTRDIGDMHVNTYHGYFAYNFGEADAKIRPFVMGGFGATNYGAVDYTRIAGGSGTINSLTKFSTTWAGGVKYYVSPKVGIRAAARFTPAYIKSDAAGWWCDPYWGCYLVGNAQYGNIFDLTGGVTFRF